MKVTQPAAPNRPEVVEFECWYYDDQYFSQSVAYLNIDGGSPDITNHLSEINFKIVHGAGSIATDSMVAHLEAGGEVNIMPGNKYRYVGQFAALVTHKQALHPDFVTFGNQELGREQQRILKRRSQRNAFDQIARDVMKKYEPVLDAFMYARDLS